MQVGKGAEVDPDTPKRLDDATGQVVASEQQPHVDTTAGGGAPRRTATGPRSGPTGSDRASGRQHAGNSTDAIDDASNPEPDAIGRPGGSRQCAA